MNIGIDIDNVLSNFDDELLKEFLEYDKKLRNSGIIDEKADNITKGMFDWSQEEIDDFYSNNIERIAVNLKCIEGAKECVKKLKDNGYKIFIISGRNNGEYSNPYKMTSEWLEKHGIEYDKLILTNAYEYKEKADICLEYNISIMIDDSVKILQEVNNIGVKTLLMDTSYNRKNNSLTRVHNWKEIYEYIINNEKI